jgi:hypothetical protein
MTKSGGKKKTYDPVMDNAGIGRPRKYHEDRRATQAERAREYRARKKQALRHETHFVTRQRKSRNPFCDASRKSRNPGRCRKSVIWRGRVCACTKATEIPS